MSRKYVPSFIIVSTSFVGFWIPSHSYPARVTLIVTSLLSLITQQVQTVHIYASYIISIHIWNNICTTFVFFGLIEFVMATCWDNTVDQRIVRKDGSVNIIRRVPKELEEVVTSGHAGNDGNATASIINASRSVCFFDKLWVGFRNFGRSSNQVDAYAKIVFPIAYMIATGIYCFWVITMEDFDQRTIKHARG